MPDGDMNHEFLALADTYAESFLLAAEEQGELEEAAGALNDLIAFLNDNPDFESFLTARSVDDDPRRELLEKLFRGRMNESLLNFLQVLNNRGRLDLIRQISRRVQLRMEARQDKQEVRITSATALTDKLRGLLYEQIKARIGKEPILIEKVKPDLIGGMIIQVGDLRIDGSVATKLQDMSRRLIERATQEVHAGRGYEGSIES
jgi:F-type H+-transporting ATPase subunit delta